MISRGQARRKNWRGQNADWSCSARVCGSYILLAALLIIWGALRIMSIPEFVAILAFCMGYCLLIGGVLLICCGETLRGCFDYFNNGHTYYDCADDEEEE